MSLASRPWTAHKDMFLRQFAAAGHYASAIAVQMKRSESAIRKRAVLLDVELAKVRLFGLKAKK
jgi:hypothetical protein